MSVIENVTKMLHMVFRSVCPGKQESQSGVGVRSLGLGGKEKQKKRSSFTSEGGYGYSIQA